MYIYPMLPRKKKLTRLTSKCWFLPTVNSGLNAKPTAKFADQLTSTAILEAGARYA